MVETENFVEFCKKFIDSKNARRPSDNIIDECQLAYDLNIVQYNVDMSALTTALIDQLQLGTAEVELFPFCVAMQVRDVVACCMNDGHIVMCSTHEASKLYDTYFTYKKRVFIHDLELRYKINEAINAKDSLNAMKLINEAVFGAMLETETT